jgi:UDP-N-acetylmuramyl pentapeptide synthase
VNAKDELIDALRQELRGGDVVLIKGSRGIGVDRVVRHLRAEAA